MNTQIHTGDVDLFWHLERLRSKWRVLLGGALLTALLTLAVALATPRLYEASSTLQLSQSKLLERDQRVVTSDVVPLLESREGIQEVLAAQRIGPEQGVGSPEEFRARHLSVEPGSDSSLVRVLVRFYTPEQAAALTDALVQRAVRRFQEVADREAADVLERLGAQVKDAERLWVDAEGALRTYRESAQVEALKKDIEIVLELRESLSKAEVDVQTERSRLDALESERSRRQPVLTLKRTFAPDQLAAEAVRDADGNGAGGSRSVLNTTLETEVVNPVFDTIDEEAVKARSTLAEAEQKRKALAREGVGQTVLPSLMRLYERESKLDSLTVQRDLSKRTYEKAFERYAETRGLLVGRSLRLVVLERAQPPRLPLPRNAAAKAVIGAIGGALIAAFLVLLRGTDRR
jgi:capsule polysaccharide export protein KpsE/RkpR